MVFNQSVSNPMLVGCIELVKAEDTREHRNMFVAELQKASLLAPALIEPAPIEDEEGNLRLHPDSKVQFPMLITSDGKMFYVGFTDDIEYQAWVEKNKPLPTFALNFDDYVRLMLRKDAEGNSNPALGFVINPFGANMVVPKDTMANIIAAQMIEAGRRAGKKASQKLRVPAAFADASEDHTEAPEALGENPEEK